MTHKTTGTANLLGPSGFSSIPGSLSACLFFLCLMTFSRVNSSRSFSQCVRDILGQLGVMRNRDVLQRIGASVFS